MGDVGLVVSKVRLFHNGLADARQMRNQMRHVSIYFHDKKSFDCPDCKMAMERAHMHGWYWLCMKCKKTFPLYLLEHKKVETPKVKEAVHG